MRCTVCAKLSLKIICNTCHQTYFTPEITKRKVGTLEVISFYKYSVIESLLLTKHTPEGFRIYKRLGEMTFRPFIEKFVADLRETVYVVGVDEYVKNGYAHVALITRKMQTSHSKVQHAVLLAQNRVSYAGKDLQYRLNNPRVFRYTGKPNVDVILVDDTITTGLTLQEAQKELLKHDVNVLFALTLADAKL